MNHFLLIALVLGVAGAATLTRKRKGADVLFEVPLIDGHNDFPYNLRKLEKNQINNFDFTRNLSQDIKWGTENCHSCFTDLPRLRAGRVGAQFWVAYVGCETQYKDAVEQSLEQIDVIKRFVAKYPNDMQLVNSTDGIWDAFFSNKIAGLIGVEGGHMIDSRLAILRLYGELGVRYLTLTHACNTPWADASPSDEDFGVPVHNGLTDFGKSVVSELNRLGIMVDISHVSGKTMMDAMEVSRAPVIFSHSSARAICNHHRNVPDYVLQKVKETNSVVMVNFYSGFISCGGQATLEDVVRHINHIRNVAGVDCVGIGGDYDGVDSVPVGLEDVSKYPDLFNRLAENRPGEPQWTDEDLKKLAGLNLLRVFRSVEMVKDLIANEIINEDLLPEIPEESIPCRTDSKFLSRMLLPN